MLLNHCPEVLSKFNTCCWNPHGNGCHTQLYTSQRIGRLVCKTYHGWKLILLGGFFSKKLGFCFHWKPHEAGSGRGNCCPLDIEAGRHTTSTDPYPVVEFYSDSKKWHWQRHRHLSVYISLSVSISLKPYSPQLRWLASIFPFFSVSLSWMPTSG